MERPKRPAIAGRFFFARPLPQGLGVTMTKPGTTLLLWLLAQSAAIAQPADNALHALFADAGVNATLVIESLDGRTRYAVNEDRAGIRFSPASTFKVPNSLIALDRGAVTGAGIEFRWDGRQRPVPAWNRDHTLASAIRVSCVWCYQAIAREVGREAYEEELRRLAYGNAVIGEEVDEFWLDGSLRISANEQVHFLRSLRQAPPPFSQALVAVLDDIMLIEEKDGYTLRGKTGWTGSGQHIGWYVGSLHSDENTWLFAMNFDMHDAAEAALRQALTIGALKLLGILPEDWPLPE